LIDNLLYFIAKKGKIQHRWYCSIPLN